jgi:hypothetical protein
MEPQTTTEPVLETTPTTTAVAPSAFQSPRTRIFIALGAILLIALAYFVYTTMTMEVAAVVNGEKIAQSKVDENVAMMTKSAELQGIDVADPAIALEIKTQALDNLINNELLLSAARAHGLSANEAAIQSAYETLVTEVGGEEELKSRMETVGLTVDTLMGNITDRLVVDQYIEAVTDIETVAVSAEEVSAYVDSISADGVALPPLEEIAPQIEASILAQKQQGIVDELIAKLRSEATIEIK